MCLKSLVAAFIIIADFAWNAGAASIVLDQNFRSPPFAEPDTAQRTLLLPDGKFLLFSNVDTVVGRQTGAITRYLADGTFDPSFSFSRDYKFVGAACRASDGQLFVSARRSIYGVDQSEFILRLNNDGSINGGPSGPVEFGAASSGHVFTITPQPDGKVLIAGDFYSFAGLSYTCIVRLLSNGQVDPTFNPPAIQPAFYGVYARPLILPDGKILLGGDFTSVDGNSALGLVRLNPDGSLDKSFQASGYVRSNSAPIRGIVVQDDGKIVLGGRFQFGSGPSLTRPPLIRLTAGGSLDASFTRVTTISSLPILRDLIRQADGKLIAPISNSVYRFTVDGALDSTFRQPSFTSTSLFGANQGSPFTVHLQPDGRFLVGGDFTEVDGGMGGGPTFTQFGVARLNGDGTLDTSLAISEPTADQRTPTAFLRGASGSTLVAFASQLRPVAPNLFHNIGRLLTDGSIDSSFHLTAAGPTGFLTPDFVASSFAELADGKIFVMGWSPTEIAAHGRITKDGAEDATYTSDPNVPFATEVVGLPDGKVVLAAGTDVQATVYGTLTRLQRNGGIDQTFQPPVSIQSAQIEREAGTQVILRMWVGSHVLAVQPDGKIIFEYLLSGGAGFQLVRLNTNGSTDATFTSRTFPVTLDETYPQIFDPVTNAVLMPPFGVYSAPLPLRDAVVQPDGRIVIVGDVVGGIIRLNANGSDDLSFNPGAGPQWTVTSPDFGFEPKIDQIALQNDGKLLLVGTFEAFSGTPAPGIVSLNPNGTIAAGFTPPAKRNRYAPFPTRLERQADGSFLLSGAYSFPNESESALIRIDSLGGVPIVGSPRLASALIGRTFTYQIVASGQPTSYGASGLPPSLVLNPTTGVISGMPRGSDLGTRQVNLFAINGEGTSAARLLTLTVQPPPPPVVVSPPRRRPGAGTRPPALSDGATAAR